MKDIPSSTYSTSYLLAISGGTLAMILGVLVLIGWHSQNTALIQVSVAFVPMQYNTALGFVLTGLGILMISRGHFNAGAILGAFATLIGLLTLSQYIFGINLGIDQILMQSELIVQTSHPGRMAPNTALCFVLAGASLIVFATKIKIKCGNQSLIAGILGSITIGLGTVALAGYAANLETAYGWGEWTRMAIHTAAGFIFTGAAIISLAWLYSDTDYSGLPAWLPLTIGIIVLTIITNLWYAIESYNSQLMEQYGDTGYHPLVNDTLLVIGMVLAATLSFAAYLTQTAKNRERQTAIINQKLSAEIEERKLAEIALLKSEERFRGVFENSEISIWNEDLSAVHKALNKLRQDGITDLRQYLKSNPHVVNEMLTMIKVLHVNKATLRLFKAKAEDDFLDQIEDSFGADAMKVFKNELYAIWDEDRGFRSEASFRSIDGKEINAIISFQIPETEGGFQSVPVSIIDISEQKQTEKALRRSQKMDAIGQLTGGIAHDFNNILAIILGNLEVLKTQNTQQDKKTQKRIQTIQKSAQRAAHLTRQLLNFSRHHSEHSTTVNINQLIEDMADLLIRSATPQVMVEFQLATDLWLARVNSGDFEDALFNLVINARDAMKGNGYLSIETNNTALDASYCAKNPGVKANDYVELIISDIGKGMTADQLEHIFEPFFTTKEMGKGTGLGLAMVYAFVERSEGHIKVYSEQDVGTTFRLYLPRASQPEQVQETQHKQIQAELPRGEATILVVDDEEALLELAKESLEDLGYRILTASNAQKALLILADETKIDLLLSDVIMPGGISGYELADQVSNNYPQIKILFASGYTAKVLASNSQCFSNNLLSKPYTLSELAHRVKKVLDN